MSLQSLGWNQRFEAQKKWLGLDHKHIGRVTALHKFDIRIETEDGIHLLQRSGITRDLGDGSALPIAVGDWVALKPGASTSAAPLLLGILPRTSTLSRHGSGPTAGEQVLAANVEWVFILCATGEDFNVNRIERYLALAWSSGAQPVILLTKIDLVNDLFPYRQELEAIAVSVQIHEISAKTGAGIDSLDMYLTPGNSAILLGSSGVGKSTLTNRLLERNRQKVLPVRAGDERGRHATTHRELFPLLSGGVIIDTPGLREVGLSAESMDLGRVFHEIETLARSCKFRDCNHRGEPDCAVRQAVEEGRLSLRRLDSFHKLRRELRHRLEQSQLQGRQKKKSREKALSKLQKQETRRKKSVQ